MMMRIIAVGALLLLAGCGVPELAAPSVSAPTPDSTSPAATSVPENTASAESSALAGTEWQLVSYGADAATKQVLENTTITITFTGTQASGSFGCNSFGGAYTVNGQQITFLNIAQTMMACAEPIMQQEQEISSALQSVQSFALEGDTLRLDYDGGTLRFTRVLPESDRTLEGASWQLTTFVSNGAARSLLAGTSITAVFENGRVAGSAGCNSYSGTYTLNNGALMVNNNIITTKKACAPDVMQQEQEFLDALAATTGYTINGTQLTLSHSGGQLVFAAQ